MRATTKAGAGAASRRLVVACWVLRSTRFTLLQGALGTAALHPRTQIHLASKGGGWADFTKLKAVPGLPSSPRAAASPSALGPPFSGCHATISPPWSGSSVPTGQLADSAQPRPDRCGPGESRFPPALVDCVECCHEEPEPPAHFKACGRTCAGGN